MQSSPRVVVGDVEHRQTVNTRLAYYNDVVPRLQQSTLYLSGIRSFGCADHEKAVVKFDIPLTLITGQNGAGKTVCSVAMHTLLHIYVLCCVDYNRMP